MVSEGNALQKKEDDFMNKSGFTTVELITSFSLASVIMIILFQVILILKDNLNEVNIKTNMLVEKDNLSYNINKRLNEKEITSITTCEDGDKCYLFSYGDSTSDKLVYSNTNKNITFNNYSFDIIDGIIVSEPTITEHYDTMSSNIYNGYFIINIPITFNNKDYSIKVVKHFNTDSLYVDIGNYYRDDNGNKYAKVDYLQSTGTQYIDTGVVTNDNTGFYLDFVLLNDVGTSNFGRLLGSSYRNSGDWGGILITSYPATTGGQFGYCRKNYDFYNPGLVSNERIIIELKNHVYTSSTGVSLNLSCSSTQYMHGNFYLLYINDEVNDSLRMAKVYLYSSKIYDGDTIVRDYIPVIDLQERPCLFDKVSKTCFYNQLLLSLELKI